jgi:phenylacetic acid degradation operon negative regulatory protein
MNDVPNVLNMVGSDDPRLLLSEPFRAAHFVYGLFHPEPRSLSGRALVGSLTTLGFSAEAARGVVLRLRRGGFLVSRRVGREAAYQLAPRSVRLLDEIARRSSDPPPPWDSTFDVLVVHIPPTERAFREQLRRRASYAGFGSPLPGLLIAPYRASRQRLEPLLDARPPGVAIVRGRLSIDVAEAVPLASEAWELGPMAAAVRRETKRMLAAARAVEVGRPKGPDALQLLWQAIGPFFELLSARPPLPSALLPRDWPLDDAREAFVRLAMSAAPVARSYVEELDAGGAASGR